HRNGQGGSGRGPRQDPPDHRHRSGDRERPPRLVQGNAQRAPGNRTRGRALPGMDTSGREAMKKVKALGLLSGGLDSMLSLAIVRDVLGCEVRAIHFYTGFCITETQRRRGVPGKNGKMRPNEALVAGAELGTEVEMIDISD